MTDDTGWQRVSGYKRTIARSGDGSTTTYSVAHDFCVVPDDTLVIPGGDARHVGIDDYYTTDREVTIRLTTAPAAGVTNVVFDICYLTTHD